MDKAIDAWARFIAALDHHKGLLTMLAGFVVAYWISEKFESWNDKLIDILKEQNAVNERNIETLHSIQNDLKRLDYWHLQQKTTLNEYKDYL